jgi:predicted RNA-binding protein with PUA-like domain
MKLGDKGFFYHSNEDKAIVGIVEVCKLAHRDSTADADTWECVDIRALVDVPQPVSLDDIKQDKRLSGMVLVKNSRLSVQPVTTEEWKMICDLGGIKTPPRLT